MTTVQKGLLQDGVTAGSVGLLGKFNVSHPDVYLD